MCRILLCVCLLLLPLAGCSETSSDELGSGTSASDAASGDSQANGIADPQQPGMTGSPPPEPQTGDGETDEGEKTDSETLREAMIQIGLRVAKEQQPDTTVDAVRAQVSKEVGRVRQHAPDFLIVPVQTEAKLKAGTTVSSSATRIAAAEKILNEFDTDPSGLVAKLLPQHKAGQLNAVDTELLAHLLAADAKMLEKALSN